VFLRDPPSVSAFLLPGHRFCGTGNIRPLAGSLTSTAGLRVGVAVDDQDVAVALAVAVVVADWFSVSRGSARSKRRRARLGIVVVDGQGNANVASGGGSCGTQPRPEFGQMTVQDK
jgi:hypothetical protein